MPLVRCQKDGKPGVKWGEQGKCYTYTPGNAASIRRAREQAERQGRAIEASKRGSSRR